MEQKHTNKTVYLEECDWCMEFYGLPCQGHEEPVEESVEEVMPVVEYGADHCANCGYYTGYGVEWCGEC